MQKKIIFISHAGPEKEIAQALKAVLNRGFLGFMDVYVSSDPESLPAGRKWLESITEALRTCAVEIVLVSPSTVRRPWINFEAGAGFVRDVPVVPLCHSGLTVNNVPQPLSFLQAVVASDVQSLRNLLPVVAKAIGSQVPEVDFSDFIRVVKRHEEETRQIESFSESSSVASTNGLKPHELATLAEIAEQAEGPEAEVTLYALKTGMEKMGYNNMATNLGLAVLQRMGLVLMEKRADDEWGNGQFQVCLMTSSGLDWLVENQGQLVFSARKRAASRRVKTGFEEGSVDIPEDDVPF